MAGLRGCSRQFREDRNQAAMWKPSAPVCRNIPFSRSAEPRVALPASPLACAPCLCPLPQGSRKKCTGHVPHTLRTTLPSLFRRGSGVPSLAQTSKEAVSRGGGGAAQPEHTMHSRCAGLSTSIPSQLLLWQCLVGVVSTPPPGPISQLKSSWLRAQLRKTLVWVTQGQASHLVFLAQHPQSQS